MGSENTISGHLVMLCAPTWGHLRPLCAFACKVVRERPDVVITFMTVGGFCQQVEREIGRYFSVSEAESRAKRNIRIVNIGGQGTNSFILTPITLSAFPGYYDKLVECQPVRCLEKKKAFDAVPKPTAVVADYFFLDVLQHIRSVSGKEIPVFAWENTFAASALHLFGPAKFGGFGDVVTKARIQAEATGRKVKDVIDELYHPSIGRLINVPGMPPMYDYEWTPQEPLLVDTQKFIAMGAYAFARECDGVVSVSSPAYDPKSLEAMRLWLGKTNRRLYAIGPLAPSGFGATGLSDMAKKMEIGSSNNGEEIQSFLDKTLLNHGKHSLIYISFGSYWWPKRNDHVWIFVDALLELEFPFILSHASSHAVIPSGYAEKVKQSGIGLLSAWSPQQTILNHPATGWFLTHCGQNSVTESLAQGIPMIAWPLDADQPGNAAYLTLSLDVAFELVEVRTGPGLKPLYRGVQPTGTIEAIAAEAHSTLQKARGADGERKRRNAESLRDKWKEVWEEGGDALKNLRQFLADCCSGHGHQSLSVSHVPCPQLFGPLSGRGARL